MDPVSSDDGTLTLEQADNRLRAVRPLLEEARRLKQRIESIAASYDYDAVLMEQEKHRIEPMIRELADVLDDLEVLGCYIKDLDIGLVDFLSTFEGRDVFLCWKLGEERISHWHELGEGFSSRQEILDLEVFNEEVGGSLCSSSIQK